MKKFKCKINQGGWVIEYSGRFASIQEAFDHYNLFPGRIVLLQEMAR
jgi:hypothetical protein